ncbi:phage associated protein [Neisseria gonorrhoeae]|uniref:Phage associated protein n=1 Tax=Neisseria gonorrhoeae TaxID=485 RepID=A0A379B1C7_NEIGO|nr:phage associated protein [Neisseria gonorrhoeae]
MKLWCQIRLSKQPLKGRTMNKPFITQAQLALYNISRQASILGNRWLLLLRKNLKNLLIT